MPAALPEQAIERFRADLRKLTGPLGAEARIGVAVSGGPDSLALLILAHDARLQIEAATVDHGLRPASADEAAFVARVCGRLGVPHATLKLGAPERGNVSDWARRERYRALSAWAAERDIHWILTAHHADDQLETMLMRLNRGSGVAGLAGVRARNGRVVRPLLGWRRAELVGIVRDAGLEAIDDPSNRDDRYDRARLRKVLGEADWLDPEAASRSAACLADAEEALDWAATEIARSRVARTAPLLHFDPRGLPAELVRRIFGAAVVSISKSPNQLRSGPLTRAIAALREGRTITLGGVRCVGGTVWTLGPAPPRRASTSGSS